MKKVLVTGGCGFIGSHITEKLLEKNYHVVVIDNLVTGNKDNISLNDVEFYNQDISDDSVVDLIKIIQPDYIIHQAAQVSVSESMKDMYYDEKINVQGSLNIIKGAAEANVKKIIFASSAAVYGNPSYLPVDTNHPTNPESPYGLTKLTVEHYLKFASEIYGLDYTALRYSNVFGPRQDTKGEGGVVAIFSEKIAHNETPVIYGDGHQSRDFIYVEDVANANIAALTKGSRMVLNVSRNDSITVNELFEIMNKITGASLSPIYEPARSGDIRDSTLCNEQTIRELDWSPEYTLKDGLGKTLEFYSKVNYSL